MTTAKITTLSEFLDQSGAKYRVFDMGRRVVKLSSESFSAFELANEPYPKPFQKKALFGVIFWNPKQAEQQYVWFLNFPLDEQGLLIQAARDEFLVMLLDRVGECMLAAEDGKHIEGALKDSPYTFKPREDKMAAFNAQATNALVNPASSYYDDALAYFTGKIESNAWQKLGMQGVADVAIRAHDDAELIKNISNLANEPFLVLSGFLENSEITPALAEVLSEKLTQELQKNQPDITLLTAYIRAASHTSATGILHSMVKAVLQHDISRDIEVLATVSGRVWHMLEQEELAHLFVEQLANNSVGQDAFSQLLADLIYLPTMRQHIMKQLRSEMRSEAVSQAVGKMFS